MTEATSPRPVPPIPRSLSDEARAHLALQGLPTDAAPIRLDDIDAWLEYIAQGDAKMRDRLERFEALPVSTEERTVHGVRVFVSTPSPKRYEGLIHLDLHGGGFVLGGGQSCKLTSRAAAHITGLETWSVDFRMPPLFPFPAGIDDVLTVYRALTTHEPFRGLIVGGGAAGGGIAAGNLASATLLRAIDEGLRIPLGLMLFSPMVDMTQSGDSWSANFGLDYALSPGLLRQRIRLYAGSHDLHHPHLSPLFGDLSRFPPTLLGTGTRDLLLSDTIRLHRKLRRSGVDADLHVWEARSHTGFGGRSPEDLEVQDEIGLFVERIGHGSFSV